MGRRTGYVGEENDAGAELTRVVRRGQGGGMSIKSIITLLLVCCGAPSRAAQTTAQVIEVISPAKAEQAWLMIPWETDLTAARRKAVAQNKPVFLWEMDGHPLGCT